MSKTDKDLHDEVVSRLTSNVWFDASRIEVKVTSGEVTLEGHVSSWESKRSAQDLAENISGVSKVHNQLKIDPAMLDDQ